MSQSVLRRESAPVPPPFFGARPARAALAFAALVAFAVAAARGEIPAGIRGNAAALIDHFDSFAPGDRQFHLDWDQLTEEEIGAIERLEEERTEAALDDPSPFDDEPAAAQCTAQPECFLVVALPSICLDKGKFPPPSASNPDSTAVTYRSETGDPRAPEFLAIYLGTAIAQDEGLIFTPFASNPDRERYQVAQNATWMRTAAEDDDPSNDVTATSIRETIHEQVEKTTGRSFESLPEATQQQVDLGAEQLFEAISTIEKETRLPPPPADDGATRVADEKAPQPDCFDPQPTGVVVATHPPEEHPAATTWLETDEGAETATAPGVGFVPGLSTGPPAAPDASGTTPLPFGFVLTGNDVASGPGVFDLRLDNPTGRQQTLLVGEGTVLAPGCTGATGADCELADRYQRELVPESIAIVLVPCPREDCTEVPEPPGDHTATIGGMATTGDDPVETLLHAPQAGGDPVFLHSGEVFVSAVDLAIAGRGLDWELRRTYRSRSTYDGPLGWNWDFADNLYLLSQGADLVLYDGTGAASTYVPGASPGNSRRWFSPMGGPGVIFAASGGFVLRRDDGVRYEFHPLDRSGVAGRIRAQVGPDGERIEYRYDAAGRLTDVRDTFGRAIAYLWNDGGRIAEVRVFAGRSVRFRYDAAGHLTHVTGPRITGTPTGNDFPEGRTVRYGYVTRNAPPRLLHNLISITAPVEVASGGPRRVTMEYDEHDRLVVHRRGGVGKDGREVGGVIRYDYARLPATGAVSSTTPLYRTRVTLRDGNTADFLFNYQGLLVERHELDAQGQPIVTRLERDALGRVTRIVYPEGNERLLRYERRSFQPVAEVLVPDKRRGGAQRRLVSHFDHEPVFDQLVRRVDPRGLEPAARASAGDRFARRYLLDYQEDRSETTVGGRRVKASLVRLAQALGFDERDPAVLGALARDLARAGVGLGLGDLNGDGREETTATGRVVRTEESVALVTADGKSTETTSIVHRYRYDEQGQLVAFVDAEGAVTRFSYHPFHDPDGDGTPTPGVERRQGGGFLAAVERDAAAPGERPAPIRLAFRYDQLGRVVAETDARGVTTSHVYNAADELVRTVEAAAVPAGAKGLEAFAYRTDFHFDANGRLVKRAVESRGERLAAEVGPTADVELAYDLLDELVEIREEIATGRFRSIRIEYDSSQRPVAVRSPLAVSGAEPHAAQTYRWGPGDTLLARTLGAGSPGAATHRYEYDKNGNVVSTTDAEDNDGDGRPEATRFVYDGFDRVVEVVERDGAKARLEHDAASNVVAVRRFDRGAATPAPPLEQTRLRYDEAGRPFEVARDLLEAAGAVAGSVVQRTRFDRLGRPLAQFEDGVEVARYGYDAAGRLRRQLDAAGNELTAEYDAAANPVRLVELARASVGGATLTRERRLVYDALGRLARESDSLGRTTRYEYGSRGLLQAVTNARSERTGPDPLGLVPRPITLDGDRYERTYDGLGRLVAETTRLGAATPGNPDGAVVLRYEWDDNDRVVAAPDDLGNVTRTVYDALGRPVAVVDAAGGETKAEYDRDGHEVRRRTPAGDVVEGVFDGAGRLTARRLRAAGAAKSTTTQTFAYDGLGRLVRATDDNDPGRADDDAELRRRYDALSRLVEETQNGRAVAFDWRGGLGVERLRYPSGRTAAYELDRLARPRAVAYTAREKPLAAFDYLGADALLSATFGNGARLDYRDAAGTLAGLDGEGRVMSQSWRAGASAVPILDLRYERDGLGRIAAIRPGAAGEPGVEVRHDATGALVGFGATSWSLDGAGNWLAVEAPNGTRTASPAAANRYASFDGRAQRHDADGRRLADGRRDFSWDALGRLREVREAGSGRLLAGYDYDALGRRVARTDADGTTRYVYAGAEVVEEQRGGARTLEFVLAAPGAEPFAVAEWTSSATAPERLLYAHRDRHPANVAALTDERGALLRAYRYDAFGALVEPADVAAAESSAWPYLFHGRRLDAATGLYDFGARFYDPEQGRFLSPDPGGSFADPATRGNAYSLGPGNGVDGVDRTGRYWQELETGGVKWMGKPGEEDYGFTTVKQLPGSWFEWRPDYVFEPTPLPPPRDPAPPEPDLPPPPEGSGWGTQLGISEDPLFYINARALDSKANAMLRDFVYVEAFASLGLGVTRPLSTAVASRPPSRPVPQGRYVEMGGMVNLTRGMKVESKFASKLKPLQGWFDVVVHGSPTRVLMKIDGKVRRLDPQQLAWLIRSNPGWAKQNIRLVSCSTGASKCGFAAQLADELGVTVMAPTKPLWMKLTSKPGKVGVETVIEVAGVKKVGKQRLPNRKDPGKMEFFYPTPP